MNCLTTKVIPNALTSQPSQLYVALFLHTSSSIATFYKCCQLISAITCKICAHMSHEDRADRCHIVLAWITTRPSQLVSGVFL